MSGTPVASLDFILPSDPAFNTGVNINKVYHPAGGGLNLKAADPNMFDVRTNPTQGWYIGRFSNTTWTPTTANDVMLAAYGIKKPVCEAINRKIKGSSTIPAFTSTEIRQALIPSTYHTGGGNVSLTTVRCPGCDGYPSLCISNNTGGTLVFYSIISAQ